MACSAKYIEQMNFTVNEMGIIKFFFDYPYIINDLVGRWEPKFQRIDTKLKRIPAALCTRQTGYDFGAMSTYIDPKVAHLASLLLS